MSIRVVTLTHFDLDGLVSSINVYNAISKEAQKTYMHFPCGYYKIDSSIEKIAKEKFDVLFVLDLNLTEAQINRLCELKRPNNKIIYIDHHEYTYDVTSLCEKNKITCIIDKTYSGCMNTFRYLSAIKPMKHLIHMNEVANCYDLWKKELSMFKEEAIPFNDLFWILGGFKFFTRFKHGIIDYTSAEKQQLALKQKDREEFLRDAIDNHSVINPNIGAVFIFAPNPEFTNDFTIYYPEYSLYLILKQKEDDKYTYSLRIAETNKLTCQEIYANVRDKFDCLLLAGGHKKTGGLTIAKENNTKFLEVFNEVIEELIARENNG